MCSERCDQWHFSGMPDLQLHLRPRSHTAHFIRIPDSGFNGQRCHCQWEWSQRHRHDAAWADAMHDHRSEQRQHHLCAGTWTRRRPHGSRPHSWVGRRPAGPVTADSRCPGICHFRRSQHGILRRWTDDRSQWLRLLSLEFHEQSLYWFERVLAVHHRFVVFHQLDLCHCGCGKYWRDWECCTPAAGCRWHRQKRVHRPQWILKQATIGRLLNDDRRHYWHVFDNGRVRHYHDRHYCHDVCNNHGGLHDCRTDHNDYA
mmetsp:Transcript_28701/g.66147  ORF Transcript_28701/g.66147 Transcript_28701/m.66147 type:complete len:258 (-) Transcript_28701:5459-6232(-)